MAGDKIIVPIHVGYSTRAALAAASEQPANLQIGLLTDDKRLLIGQGADQAPLEFINAQELIAPVLINVPSDYPTVEAALNSLAGKLQNSTITEIKVNTGYVISATEKWYSYGLKNILVTTSATSPETLTINVSTGINFKQDGITLENLNISGDSGNLLYFARNGKTILSNLNLVNSTGKAFTTDIGQVEINDCDITSSGIEIYASHCVIRRCNMTATSANSGVGCWSDAGSYVRTESTNFKDFWIGQQSTHNTTSRNTGVTYTNNGTDRVNDSTSIFY